MALLRVCALDVLARFFPRSAESREEGLSVGELESSGLRGAILFADGRDSSDLICLISVTRRNIWSNVGRLDVDEAFAGLSRSQKLQAHNTHQFVSDQPL
jgi:hypothetical protein